MEILKDNKETVGQIQETHNKNDRHFRKNRWKKGNNYIIGDNSSAIIKDLHRQTQRAR